MSNHFDLDDALAINEGADSPEALALSLQRAINSGSAWTMEGSMGRAMMRAIEAGDCMLGPKPCRDYWQNFIPSRDMVQAGTKGSRQFVVDHHDEDWAVMLDKAND